MECSGAVSGIPHRGAIHRAAVDTLVGPLCRLVERRDAALVVGDQGVAGRTRADEPAPLKKTVTPPSVLAMTELPALAALVKLRLGVAATTPPLATIKEGALAEWLAMPAPVNASPAVWLVVPKVKACAPALKVKPPRVAGPEDVIGRPVAPKKAVPVGTVVGNQLAALLKLLVTPFQVAFCARTPGTRPTSHNSKATQDPAT